MSEMKMKKLLDTVFVVILLTNLLWNTSQGESIVRKCMVQCTQNLVETVDATSGTCDSECLARECHNGCGLWKRAIAIKCLNACGEAQVPIKEIQHCISGCNVAVDIYAQEVKDKLANISSPEISANSITNTSVILTWDGSLSSSLNCTVLLQMAILNSNLNENDQLEHEWQYCDLGHWEVQQNGAFVMGLQPYTQYQFRIVLEIVNGRHSAKSPPSVPFVTKSYGVPTEPPEIINLASTPTSIHFKWRPPRYINAGLVGYRINLTCPTDPTFKPQMKEVVETTRKVMMDTIARLTSDTTYVLSMAVINENGVGPTVQREIATRPTTIGVTKREHLDGEGLNELDGTQPFLIIAEDNTLRKKNLTNLWEAPILLFESKNSFSRIEGVAMHYTKLLLFISLNDGVIYKLEDTNITDIYNTNNGNKALDVDWLNEKIYIAERDKIIQCDLDGHYCVTVVDNLSPPPEDIKVDPCNGFFFWAQLGKDLGIYRVDLADIRKYGEEKNNTTSIRHVITADMVSTMAIDYINYQLFYPNETHNTMMSTNLDGSDLVDIRKNAHNTEFIVVKRMTYHRNLFYWTGNHKVFMEEHDTQRDNIHHNEMYFDKQNAFYTGLNVWHPASQPTPVPLHEPKDVQVVFTTDSAFLTWSPPDFNQGRGSWNKWKYEIKEIDLSTGRNRTLQSEEETKNRIGGLKPNVVYRFQIRAYSDAGYGPWSPFFIGQTLRLEDRDSYLMTVDSDNTMHKMTLNGEPIEVLDEYLNQEKVAQLKVFPDKVLWVSVSGQMYIKPNASQVSTPIRDVSDVKAFDYDWLGHTLYWVSKRPATTIKRMYLKKRKNNLPEVVIQEAEDYPIRDISVDSGSGYIYWHTERSLEVARLNGQHSDNIHREADPYSDRYVISIEIDFDGGMLYWLIRSRNGLSLYRRSLFGLGSSRPTGVERMMTFELPHRTNNAPKLHHLSNKLFWIGPKNHIYILDTTGQSLTTFTIDSRHQMDVMTIVKSRGFVYPEGVDGTSASVIPRAVTADSFSEPLGGADDFTVTWQPVRVQRGDVYYRVQLSYDGEQQIRELPYASVRLHEVEAYSRVAMSVQACTYWGCSTPRSHTFHSPEAVPTKPRRPRCYIEHQTSMMSSEKIVEVDFWWYTPQHPNGRLTRHIVSVSTNSRDGPWENLPELAANKTSFKVKPALPNAVYYFKVRACTSKGCGPYSDVTSANTTVVNPVSIILTASRNSVYYFYPNDHMRHDLTLWEDGATYVTYIAREDTFYMLNNMGALYETRKNTTSQPRPVFTSHSGAKELCCDWVGRHLYWTVSTARETKIMKLDLYKPNNSPVVVLSRANNIWSLAFKPSTRSLYWTETANDGKINLMSMRTEGGSDLPTPVFSRTMTRFRQKRQEHCSCGRHLSISKQFALDPVEDRLFVIEKGSPRIWSAPLDGCSCRKVFNGELSSQPTGLPADFITVDLENIYWSRNGHLFSVNKETGQLRVDRGVVNSSRALVAYGKHLQPMPDYDCLIINDYSLGAVELLTASATALVLKLPEWLPDPACHTTSWPSVMYRVHYRKVDELSLDITCLSADSLCEWEETFDTDIELGGLEPFTQYLIQVSVTNHYTDVIGNQPAMGQPFHFTTSNGVPSAPREVEVSAVNARSVLISWRSPANPNSELDDIEYKIQWRSETQPGSLHEQLVYGHPVEGKGEGRFYEETITGLTPARQYNFTVYAQSSNSHESSPSASKPVTTFQLPGRITLLTSTHDSLALEWTSPLDGSIVTHKFEISEINDKVLRWQPHDTAVHHTNPGTKYTATFTELKPNRKYQGRMTVIYKSHYSFTMPSDPDHIFKTSATFPARPNAPVMVTKSGVKIVEWSTSGNGGHHIEEYKLEARQRDGKNWTVVYNSSKPHWMVDGLEEGALYVFRVSARNSVGWSNMSEESVAFRYLPLKAASEDSLVPVVSTVFGFLAVLIILCGLVYLMYRRNGGDPKFFPARMLKSFGVPIIDTELATLRELPRNGIQMPNALYAVNYIPTDEDIAALPHIRREQLTLTTFLGSGAFGEVFEGIARNLEAIGSDETTVAVKTLRKSASSVEKQQFLKEALLMSTIRHANILGLLGVCLDSESQFIILELMDGGDLLSYLRVHRGQNSSSGSAGLDLMDMLDMCLDVCNGCCFLEDMHLVHRDLAARNCLVSLNVDVSERKRIVKIGDFGLARDIYKNDYYRKEGEGLMPVKWMSPESLIDGVFTTQSDVWSFGILVYEILTLGQQPYPTRTNLDVLNFVRFGGRLDKPENCPDELYELMRKCWQFDPEDRPSFHTVYEQLLEFKARPLQSPEPHYVKSGALRVQLPPESRYEQPGSSHSPQPSAEASKAKTPKGDLIRRCHSFDVKSRFGIRPSSSYRHSNDASGYLEPLLVSKDHKYLEILDALDPRSVSQKCIYCSSADCSGSCPAGVRRLARHSSDCTHRFSQAHSPSKRPIMERPQAFDSDLPESDYEIASASSPDWDEGEGHLTRKCNGISYSNIPQYSSGKINNNDEKPAGHKPLRMNTLADSFLGLPKVKRSHSFSPRYSTPNGIIRGHSNRKSMDSIHKSSKHIGNGAIPKNPKYQNMLFGGEKAEPGASNGLPCHAPLLSTRSFDETKESAL